MRRRFFHRNALRFAALTLLGAVGCSLVNGFDDVKPLVDGTYGASDGSALTDGNLAVDGSADAAGTAIGAIVVGARIDTDANGFEYVLAVLDPATGHEIAAREPMVVTAVVYDGLRDLWYIFEAPGPGFLPGPYAVSTLHVRSFDLEARTWTEHSKLTVPRSSRTTRSPR